MNPWFFKPVSMSAYSLREENVTQEKFRKLIRELLQPFIPIKSIGGNPG
jgi:hypothetical protein